MNLIDTPIEYLKGVGPTRATLLQRELGIFTFGDLLLCFPNRYVDRSHISTIATIDTTCSMVVLRGQIHNVQTIGNGRSMHLSAQLTDGTGTLELVWFKGLKWVKDSIKPSTEYTVMGKPTLFNGHVNIAHPELEPINYNTPQPDNFIAVYPSTEKLKAANITSKSIAKLVRQLFVQLGNDIPETIPPAVVNLYHLPTRAEALTLIHNPRVATDITNATARMKFEELFFMQLDYLYGKKQRELRTGGRIFAKVGEKFNTFYHQHLPFELTGAQKRVVKEIRNDMKSGHQMNRLLQGDVGSGKTLVALLCMLLAIDNGCQTCLMAPTEILAKQHHSTICRMLGDMRLNIALLTGATRTTDKKKIKTALREGEIDILIGTHALLEDNVQFADLGLVVIDEQHRFGVEQRSKLWVKNSLPPHVLVMTATPIPRTLAMTVYGDLDCSVIDELPPGRRPIKTIHSTEAGRLRVISFLRSEIAKGRQVYVVYPLIDESETLDLNNLDEGYDSITRDFPMPQYQTAILHGRMSAEAKEYEMERFKSGIANIMVSTTVIEVGVDVPNATVMVIENAERFGLSQLHQLRGRVGRGGEQSYCILMTKEKLSSTGRERINTMVNSTDGFRIAEADLKLRGPGDLQGKQQSGLLQLKLADIVNDEPMVRATRDIVQQLLDRDPQLQSPELALMKRHVEQHKTHVDWGKIS